ncbi:1336_t:CDS:2 [Cetraspora pellucida]|uniref:1336_t:CDS:1 n=1 Tax=Cetraspora pellucida TaxID=1433469 RepID=A0A9N9A704_9GLOM|nr:1336_t:CDS:2 [Cetraspora pellucida]
MNLDMDSETITIAKYHSETTIITKYYDEMLTTAKYHNDDLKEIFLYLEFNIIALTANSIRRYIINDFKEECIKLYERLQEISEKLLIMTNI